MLFRCLIEGIFNSFIYPGEYDLGVVVVTKSEMVDAIPNAHLASDCA